MNSQLLEKILENPRLPSLPAVAMQVIDLCRQDTTSVREMADVLALDPALASKVLKTVNSSYYGLRVKVSDVERASLLLGMDTVRMLALGFSLVPTLRKAEADGFNPTKLWQRLMCSAIGAVEIGKAVDVPNYEEAFIGGLLQDLGLIAMLTHLGDRYGQMLAYTQDKHHELAGIEQDEFDLTHLTVGQTMAERWSLPDSLVQMIRWHEQPEQAPEYVRPVVQAVALGALAADACLWRQDGKALARYLTAAHDYFNLPRDRARELLEATADGNRQLAKQFDITPEGVKAPPEELLSSANEMLASLSIRTARDNQSLTELNHNLAEEASTDALTGLANRGAFDRGIERALAEMPTTGASVGLILLDLDHFKAVNDTHGHDVGDEVLRKVAHTLGEVTPEHALVARYGGEEFAVLLPGDTINEATDLAELIRSVLDTTKADLGNGLKLQFTASCGVACAQPDGPIRAPKQLLTAADRAMYAAKDAGRNTVRVFRVSPSPQNKVA